MHQSLRPCGRQVIASSMSKSLIDPGIDDDQVLDLANQSGALLLTSDKDFGELVFRQGLVHAGVILYRLAGLTGERKAAAILNVLRTHGDTLLGAFTLVSPAHVRIRAKMPGGH